MNSLWAVTYGNYELTLDRKARTYRLVETKTGAVWADGLSLGWVELRERVTGAVTRHDFGLARTFSISENAGPQGKRILLGLDIEGVPLDIYLISSEREIQIVLESNRDSKTHTVEGFGLLPGLCAVPNDGQSRYILPIDGGIAILADSSWIWDAWNGQVWDGRGGLEMSFVGAIRHDSDQTSGLALITDSAYASLRLEPSPQSTPDSIHWMFRRDPERRRIDLRIIPLPDADWITIARTYREKVISDGNHITLRRKFREHPTKETLPGSALISLPMDMIAAPEEEQAEILRNECGIDRALALVDYETEPAQDNIRRAQAVGFLTGSYVGPYNREARRPQRLDVLQADHITRDCLVDAQDLQVDHLNPGGLLDIQDLTEESPEDFTGPIPDSRWEDMEQRTQELKDLNQQAPLVGVGSFSDWASPLVDFAVENFLSLGREIPLPLNAVVYRDSLVFYYLLHPKDANSFLNALIRLSPPSYSASRRRKRTRLYIRRTYAVLSLLHRLTFTAFLTTHRFLTPDFMVEEAIYSDRTRVVINRSATTPYETDEFALPPQGFYVHHTHLIVHDALRVGDENLPWRSWRIYRNGTTEPEMFSLTP